MMERQFDRVEVERKEAAAKSACIAFVRLSESTKRSAYKSK